jgi:uncharacterized protein YheU (UPF0270 family)
MYEDDNKLPAEADECLPVLVPAEHLNQDTLRQLAIEFLLRETGNDISESGVTEDRIGRVLNALRKKTHFITFDPMTESAGIIDGKNLKVASSNTSKA